MAEDLDNTIRENASGPKRARGDSGEIGQHALEGQIDADKCLAQKGAHARMNFGLPGRLHACST